MTDLAELRRLAEAATPGPWRVREDEDVETADGEYVAVDREGLVPAVRRIEDAAYIAAANPATILALLDRLDAFQEAQDLIESSRP